MKTQEAASHSPIRAGLVSTCLAAALFAGCSKLLDKERIQQGDELVRRVEHFRQENHRLPLSFQEAGITDPQINEQYFMHICSNDKYILWFGTSLGNSISYSSTTRTWKAANWTCEQELGLSVPDGKEKKLSQ